MSTKIATILSRCAFILGALSWGGFIELYIYLAHTRPHVVDAGAGRIYELNSHGLIAWLTLAEESFLYSLEYAAWGFFAAGALLQYFKRREGAKVSKNVG